jgi:hypothetical protein
MKSGFVLSATVSRSVLTNEKAGRAAQFRRPSHWLRLRFVISAAVGVICNAVANRDDYFAAPVFAFFSRFYSA